MNNKSIAGIIAILVIGGLIFYYQENIFAYLAAKTEQHSVTAGIDNTAYRKISAISEWDVPEGGSHRAEFSVFLDDEDIIRNVGVIELDGKSQDKMNQFADGLYTAIKGKKLSELGAVDRIGTSSLTTGAFNAALPDLQAQL